LFLLGLSHIKEKKKNILKQTNRNQLFSKKKQKISKKKKKRLLNTNGVSVKLK
jgi:hypothetical protein